MRGHAAGFQYIRLLESPQIWNGSFQYRFCTCGLKTSNAPLSLANRARKDLAGVYININEEGALVVT